MTLRQRFKQWLDTDPRYQIRDVQLEVIAEDFTTNFTKWKDDNFHKYRDNMYYANTSSRYFDITKYVGKEKPTVYYTIQSLMEIYKKEKGL